ncbi:hypothetical protein Ancab_019217, partial [Ancistrocladus abbreviatus]
TPSLEAMRNNRESSVPRREYGNLISQVDCEWSRRWNCLFTNTPWAYSPPADQRGVTLPKHAA